MSTPSRRFPIPNLWIWVFAWLSLGLLAILAGVSRSVFGSQNQGKIILAIALLVTPVFFFVLHKIGLFAESRGWIYYQHPRTSGLKAGVALDLEILMTARPTNQIENIRKAHLAHNESAQQDGESDKPPEKETRRRE